MMNEARDDEIGAADDDGFSIAVLVERLDGDEEIAREVAVAFVESSRELMQELDTAIGAGQADAVRLHAHSIKGASANIGADRVAEIAGVIEDAGRDGAMETAAQAMPGLQERVERVCVFLENWT